MNRAVADSSCPICGRGGIPVLFGLPASAAFEAAEAGELALAGCVVSEDPPNWACPEGHEWLDTATDEKGWDALVLRILEAHGHQE